LETKSQCAQAKTQVKQLQDQVTKVGRQTALKPMKPNVTEQFIADYTEKIIDATK